jgi:hypothetical protein
LGASNDRSNFNAPLALPFNVTVRGALVRRYKKAGALEKKSLRYRVLAPVRRSIS